MSRPRRRGVRQCGNGATQIVTDLLDDLNVCPPGHMSLRIRGLEMDFRQVRGWYFEIRSADRVVQRGVRNEALTEIEIEDLLNGILP